jgi:hypothetical protein
LKLSFLYGIRWNSWRRLLRENGYRIDARGLGYAALISAMAVQNEALSRRDQKLHLDQVEVMPPIFILGHWRSGTTHLHRLLYQDPALAAPTAYDCAFPHSFVASPAWHKNWASRAAPHGRPQDRMIFNMGVPQEDELALSLLSLRSPYLGWAFPREEERYRKYLDFEQAEDNDRDMFEAALKLFAQKLSYKYGKRLVFKSPTHTARIPILLKLFPEARFIFLTRDPFRIFQSSMHLYRTWLDNIAFLQNPSVISPEKRVFELFEVMFDSFLKGRHLIPENRLSVVRFEDLEQNPQQELERIYDDLDLSSPPGYSWANYLQSIKQYRKNEYPELSAELRFQVLTRWRKYFHEWGYLD